MAAQNMITLSFPGIHTLEEFFSSQKENDLKLVYMGHPYDVHFVSWNGSVSSNGSDTNLSYLRLLGKDKTLQLDFLKESPNGNLLFKQEDNGYTTSSLTFNNLEPTNIKGQVLAEAISPQLSKQVDIVPVEKLKGEINDEFRMSYIGRDKEGNYYQAFDPIQAQRHEWEGMKQSEYLYLRNNLHSIPIFYEAAPKDLFEHPEMIPDNVNQILDYYSNKLDNDYNTCQELVESLEKVGYTCEYDLNGVLYDLKKIDNSQLNNPSTIMATNEEKVTGHIGASGVKFTDFPETGKRVANFQIAHGTGENVKWQSVTAWNEMADRVKDMGKGDKVTVKGVQDKNTKDGKTFEFLLAKDIEPHKLLKDFEVVVGNVEFKTPKEKEIGELVVYNNQMEGGVEKNERYNVSAFEKNKDKLKELDLKPGDKIIITGDAKTTFKDDKQYVNVTLLGVEVKERKSEQSQSTDTTKAEGKAEDKDAKKGNKTEQKAEKASSKSTKKGTSQEM